MKALDVIRRPKRCPRCGGEICDFYAKKVQFCFALSGNSLTFTIEFRRHWGGVWKDFTEKGVIEITNL